MLNLPPPILHVLALFAPLFSYPVYNNACQLFCGHILCKGRRTIADILRQIGLKNIRNYSKYHWVLSGAKWNSINGAKILLQSLAKLCKSDIIISIDSTVERRKGEKIKGLGRQRDSARSSKNNKVLTVGLNWLVCAIHVKFPWAVRSWACPFLTILMPPKKPLSSSKNQSDLNRKKPHKTLNQWACLCVRLLTKWIGRSKNITIVADSAFATYVLANTCIDNRTSLISRMRLDARTFAFPTKSKRGRPRLVGKRLPTFKTLSEDVSQSWKETTAQWYGNTSKVVSTLTGICMWYGYGIRPVPIRWVLVKIGDEVSVLFSTNLEHSPEYIIEAFIERWQIETTFEESRRHLGVETQRQWSDRAIDRTTPCLFASYSIINLMAYRLTQEKNEPIPIQKASWYSKKHACFSDVISYLRLELLNHKYFSQFGKKWKHKKNLLDEIVELLAAA